MSPPGSQQKSDCRGPEIATKFLLGASKQRSHEEVIMKVKYFLKKVGGVLMAAILVSGIAIFSTDTAQAQRRGRRVIIVRPYRPYRHWGYDPFRRYDTFRYNQYVFSNSEKAMNEGYKDGYKTGKDDGKKEKSFDPERSHYFQEAGFGNFAEAYRSGFARGYQDGYRNGNSG
jgi:hypothetical protein